MYKLLSAWINWKQPLPERFYNEDHVDKPNEDWAVWLDIEEESPLHLATNMKWQSLENSRRLTQTYLNEADEIIDGLEGGWLDNEEREWVLEQLGEPPLPCLPLYLITCTDTKGKEKLVYVGKTKSDSRFSGGHAAALKLHDPKYDGTTKKIYRATIWFYFNDEYISLDWIQPEKLALELFDSVESQLIFHFKPELNKHKKQNNHIKWNFHIHIQNFLKSGFLNDSLF